jgi:outer membrane receptor protein involved in Fe transport
LRPIITFYKALHLTAPHIERLRLIRYALGQNVPNNYVSTQPRSLAATFLGQRFLDAQNQFTTPGYLSADASLGYGFKDLAIGLSVANIGDRREPLVASELGDSQIYRQVGRRIFLKLTYRLP